MIQVYVENGELIVCNAEIGAELIVKPAAAMR